jgi:murein DD-endopeptidase MepM/ murein hydrolase activator NlpD
MRVLAAIALAALLALAVTASGAEPRPRASALALIAAGTAGPHGAVSAKGDATKRDAGQIAVTGLRVGNGESHARANPEGAAYATAVARSVSLLDGRVTAYGVRRTAEATLDGVSRSGRVEGLEVDGTAVGTVENRRTIEIAGGRVIVNRGSIGLRVVLDDGTDLRIAVADAEVRPPRAQPTPEPTPEPTPTATPKPERGDKPAKKAKLERRAAPAVRKRLTRGGFAFPVYGDEATFSSTFGAPRQPVIGTHQGNDIFAPFGTPVVAVADGTVSRVGTLEISGNRLWLTTESGDAFFYAHLSAFSPAAVDGAQVQAGTVLGFVGNTGDAEPTPPHLHFQVHPGGEEEDPVDPYPILLAWQGRRDVPADAWLREYGPDTTERPGALVTVRDFIAE